MAAVRRIPKDVREFDDRSISPKPVLLKEDSILEIAILLQPRCSYCRAASTTVSGECDTPLGGKCYCELCPYAGGTFILAIEFPNDYPFKPPTRVSLFPPIKSPYTQQDGGAWSVVGNCCIKERWSPATTLSKVVQFYMDNLFEPLGQLAADIIRATNHPARPQLLRGTALPSKRLHTVLLGTRDSGSPLFALCNRRHLLEMIWSRERQLSLELMEHSPRWAKLLSLISKPKYPAEDGAYKRAGSIMSLNVKTITSKNIVLQAGTHDTIEVIKHMLDATENISPKLQRILFAGELLVDGRTLADYGIQEGNTVHLIRKLGCAGDPANGSAMCTLDISASQDMTDWEAFDTRTREYTAQECTYTRVLAQFTQEGVWQTNPPSADVGPSADIGLLDI